MKLLSNLTLKGKRTLLFIWAAILTVVLVLVALLTSLLGNKYDFSKYSSISSDENFALSLSFYETRHSSYENPSHEIEYSNYYFEVNVRGIKETGCTYKAQKLNIEMVVKTIEGEYYHLSKDKTSLLSNVNNGKTVKISMDDLIKNVHDQSEESSNCDHIDQTPEEVYINLYYHTIKTSTTKDADGKDVKTSEDVKGNIYYKTSFKDVEKYKINKCNDKTFNKIADNKYENAPANNEYVDFQVKFVETTGKTPTADNGVSVDKIEITPILNKNALGDKKLEHANIVIIGSVKNEILDYKNKFADKVFIGTFSGNINEYTQSINNSIDELYDIDSLYFFVELTVDGKNVSYQYKLNLKELA